MAEDNYISPKFLNLDSSYEETDKSDSPFIKGLGWDINANGELPTGTGNGSGEGQNEMALTPTRSTVKFPQELLPTIGKNTNVGWYESELTKELYYMNHNSHGFHGIYVINGELVEALKVIVDPKLAFSDNPRAFMADHRVSIRLIKNALGEVVEKILMITDGTEWQKWVLVNTAIATNGFDASLFPYWSLQSPHFDREELFQYPTRKPMVSPIITAIPNTVADKGVQNKLLDTGFEFCFQFVNTDGRETEVSPFSTPFYVKTEAFLSNPDNIIKKILLKLSAGSPLTEKINIYYRLTKKEDAGSNRFVTWGLWYLYDTIYKYTNNLTNTNSVFETPYWLRTSPWSAYNYNAVFNTIEYVFDNSKLGQVIGQDLFLRVETALPQLNVSFSDIGDAMLASNCRIGYDNFSEKVTDKLSMDWRAADNNACPVPTRKVTLYAYIGNSEEDFSYLSQVGYFLDTDTQFRFGGMRYSDATPDVAVLPEESKYFKLDFADREAFRVYFKGTPYFADGKWYQVNSDNSLVKLAANFDFSLLADRTLAKNIFDGGAYFVCVFEAELPAGRYIATLGRHNVASTSDYINTSTYIMGIANSRVKSQAAPEYPQVVSIKPNALVTTSKEMEIDCTAGDVNVWGNNADLFYVFCPHISRGSIAHYRFVEGYIKESPDRILGFELLPYNLTGDNGSDQGGVLTDKNGFYWGYTKADNSDDREMGFTYRKNCAYPAIFIIYSSAGFGWKENGVAYYSTYNGNQVGFGNYVVYRARITDVTGAIGYSNVGISIKDGSTVYTDGDGNARLIIHNGQQQNRQSNVYINAGSDFIITLDQCGPLPVSQYNENSVPCQTSTERVYPTTLTVAVRISIGEEKSTKSNATYIGTIVGADLAGRQTNACKFAITDVPSFLQRNSVTATFLQWAISGPLQLNQDSRTADIKWIGFFISRATNYQKYLQWVGDKVEFIDSNGAVTTSPSNSVFVRITIDSLLNANIKQNFTLFANYEFVNGDRLRVFDDGAGHLYDTATYGDMIDVDIQGTNYNQAAISANLVAPLTNTVIPANQTVGPNPTTLYVKYDSKFDKLKDKTGFWIELYTPSQNLEKRPFGQVEGFLPVVNGEIAIYTGGGVSAPQYTYPTTGKLNFWDTYLLRRSISILNAGNKFFNHPFESPNITDLWGANAISWGQQAYEDPAAKQMWYDDTTLRSDPYITNGTKNGLGTWRSENKKDFKGYQRGGIIAVICDFNLIFFLCENGWFVTSYNYQYIFANQQGVQVANLDDNMGEPHQKKGDNFGCAYENTKTVFANTGMVGWHDAKNGSYVISNYQDANDITDIISQGKRVGIKSYYTKKSQFVSEWNETHNLSSWFDISVGLDEQLNNLYVTFRPRRQNTQAVESYVNDRRNVQLENQETFTYNLNLQRWVRTELFAPESYARIRSFRMSNNMFSFVNGNPYYHSSLGPDTFCRIYGLLVKPVLIVVVNDKPENDKILMSITEDINGTKMWCDMIYSNDDNGYSYIPTNYFIKKNTGYYAPVLKNMNTYPPLNIQEAFRSFLMDGKHVFGRYFVVRFVMYEAKLGEYFEVNKLYYKTMPIGNNQK